MISNQPFFSILIPAYNVENYIRDCFESLVNQTFDDFEIIIVDDGSTDQTGYLCDCFKLNHPEKDIKIIHKKNEGLVLARRTAIDIAKGHFFVYVDSDDFIEERTLEFLYTDIIESDADLVIFHSNCYQNGKYSFFRNTIFPDRTLLTNDNKDKYYEATLKHTISNGIWGKAVSRELVDVGKDYSKYKDVTLGEDLLQSLPYITYSQRIFFANRELYHYRIRKNSMAHSFDKKRYNSLRKVEYELHNWSQKWRLEDRENLVMYHALNEAVWGSLRMLSKSNEKLDAEETKVFLYDMSNDTLFEKYYERIPKNYFGHVKYITLNNLFNKNMHKLIFDLYTFRIANKIIKA